MSRQLRQFSYPVPPRGLAIICLFGILSLALYSVVLKPIQDSMHPSIKISKVPVHEGDSVFGTLISIMERPLTPQWCIVLAVPVSARLDNGLPKCSKHLPLTGHQHTKRIPIPSNGEREVEKTSSQSQRWAHEQNYKSPLTFYLSIH